MLPRDMSVYAPSARAEQNYRRLHRANLAFYAILAVMAILGVWNVISVASMIRGGAVDLADVSSITEHPSARLINILAIVALIVVIVKEWKWGDRNFAIVGFLGILLFLWLVPVMSAEIQPAEDQVRLDITYTQCAPGGIEGSSDLDTSLCEIADMNSVTMFMAASNPLEGEVELLPPDAVQPNTAQWNVTARGHFTVYFLVEQDSIEACEAARFTTSASSRDEVAHHCLEQGGVAYSAHPYTTDVDANSWFTIYQEREP